MPLWDYESDADRRGRVGREFRSHTNRSLFRYMARTSLSRRGIDPDTIPSLGLDMNLSSKELGQVSSPSSAYTPGREPTTPYAQEQAAKSAVGEDYLWEQSMSDEGYSPEQIQVWKKVNLRASEIMREGRGTLPGTEPGLLKGRALHIAKEGIRGLWTDPEEPAQVTGGDAEREAFKMATKELTFDEAQQIAEPGGFLGIPGRIKSVEDFFYDANTTINEMLGTPQTQEPLREEFGLAAAEKSFAAGREYSRPIAEAILPSELEDTIAEDIITEVINPATLVMVLPMAPMGITTSMSAKAMAAQMVSNMLGTGMEPALVRGALRTATAAGRRGIRGAAAAPQVVEAGGRAAAPHEISAVTAPIPTVRTHEIKLQALDEAIKRDKDYVKFTRGEVKAGSLSQEMVDEATTALAQRRKDYRATKKALADARIDNEREELIFSARANGADDNVIDLLTRAFNDSIASEPVEEVLLSASGWRRAIASVENILTGTPPGVSGRLAHRRDILLSALRRHSVETADPIFGDVQKLLNNEIDNIAFTGEKKWREAAMGTYKKYHVVQHPEWFTGMSRKLSSRLEDAQAAMRTRLDTAKSLGYPIEALDDLYLEQLWEIPSTGMTSPSVHLPGRVSVAKPKFFDDYLTGLNQGFTPKDMTVEELMQHSSGLLDQAVSDAWMRQEVLRRFGSRTPRRAIAGRTSFQHPLYRGYNAPADVVNWIEGMEKVVGPGTKRVQDVAARFKGTVFGVVDIAVTGVQIPLSIAQGGIPGLMGTLNRSLEMLRLPYFHLYAKDPAVVGRWVSAAEDSVHIGWGPSSIVAQKGTVIHYAPRVGKAIDKPIAKVIDKSAQVQFGAALTNIRVRMHEGNLIILKLMNHDIWNSAVRKMSGEWANAVTGASRGPMSKGRRAGESILLTSTQMTRGNLAVYGQAIKGLSPKASSMERLRTAVTFGNLFATVYGIQYLFNSAFGDGPMEYVPGRPDWATIRVAGRTVPIIPQRSILRAIDKSLKIIERHVKDEPGGSLGDIPKAWAQVIIGKANPMVAAPLAAAGIAGFEPGTGQYRGGGLSTEAQIMGTLPVPPLVEQAAFQERDVATLSIAALGFNPYATSSGKMLREQFTDEFDEEINWESPAHRDRIEGTSKLNTLWEKSKKESREYGSEAAITAFEVREEVAQAELDKGIERLAEAVLSGDPLAALNWSDARANFLPWRSGKWDNRLTSHDPKTEIGQLVNQFYMLNPKDPQFTDSSGMTDWGAFREARELVLGQMPTDDAKAIRDKEKFISPKAEKVDKEFRAAQDALREFWDLGDGVWKRLRSNHAELRQYDTYEGFKAAKAEELLSMGVPQQDLQWRLGRLPIITNIEQLVASVRFQHRLSHPDLDALLVKWYGNTPARAQISSGSYRSRKGR